MVTSRTPTVKPQKSEALILGKRKASEHVLRNEIDFDVEDVDGYMPRHSLTFALKRPRLNTHVFGASGNNLILNDRPCDVLESNENSPTQLSAREPLFEQFTRPLPKPQQHTEFETDFRVPQLDPFLQDKFSFLDKPSQFISMTPRLKTSSSSHQELLRSTVFKRSSNSCY